MLVLKRTTVYDLGDGWAEGNSSLGVVPRVSVGTFLSSISLDEIRHDRSSVSTD